MQSIASFVNVVDALSTSAVVLRETALVTLTMQIISRHRIWMFQYGPLQQITIGS
jgi:hypothetical protein